MFVRTRMDEDALILGAYAIVSAFADRGFTDSEIKHALHPQMIDAFLKLRQKRDQQRHSCDNGGEDADR